MGEHVADDLQKRLALEYLHLRISAYASVVRQVAQ